MIRHFIKGDLHYWRQYIDPSPQGFPIGAAFLINSTNYIYATFCNLKRFEEQILKAYPSEVIQHD